ncbi:WD40 repeat domain-containing protein [Nonomuraea wenchangensis]|uniref:WD40 repeat n=1 Tax=Nonomuraea wenchangensis TaxID=568860 RepID=A0A1I0HCP4_9ACTN|nr:WD40 repeat domain-containing protein [Nonomuraea wenchangensis]SET80736.1 WD40 repeat [Nonomuraea wenchangensis]
MDRQGAQPPEPGRDVLTPQQVAAAQEGARTWVRRVARAGGRAFTWGTPRALLAALCASALTPLLVAGPGTAVLVAGIGVVGSVGANVLSDLISAALAAARDRSRGDGAESSADMERELAARLEEALQAGDARADALAEALVAALTAVDAAQAAIGEALVGGQERLLEELVVGFAELGRQNAALEPMLGRLDAAAGQIQQTLYRQDAERRLDRAHYQQQTALLLVMRDQLGRQIRDLGRRLGGVAGAEGGTRWSGGCPYQGLAPFGPAQAELFYGRGQAVARLVAMVTACGHGLVVVTGASGVGKSSLLHAGLLPALAADADWPQLTLTPGARPLQELAVQLAVRCGADPDAVLEELRRDPGRGEARARQVLSAEGVRRRQAGSDEPPRRLVIVVDQFEELFTLATEAPAEEAEAFVAALEAIAVATGPVIVATRGDFVDRCAAYPQLARALEERVFVLGPMSDAELQRAITGPAAAAGLTVEEGLAEQVVRELAGHLRAPAGSSYGGTTVGALPLLSMAMVRTWENRQDGRLTRHGYDRSGGVASAVNAAAEDVYHALDAGQQAIARRALLSLALIGADGQATRRRVTLDELTTSCAPGRPERVEQVVAAFTEARLMVAGSSPAPVPGARTVELAHDVLMTAWPRLSTWLAEDQADRVLHGEIVHDAAEWNDAGRDPSFLYRGIRLETGLAMAARWRSDTDRYPGLSGPAEDFLHAGARAASRSRRRWQGVFVLLSGLLVIAIVTAISAVRLGQEAEQQRDMALRRSADILSRQLAADSEKLSNDPPASARLAATAWTISPTSEARASMATVLGRPGRALLADPSGSVFSVAFSLDGSRLGSAGRDGTLRLWDAATGRQLGAPLGRDERGVRSVAFSRDGSRLASAGGDGTVRLWDTAAREQLGTPLTGHNGTATSVAFSPDGSRLASAGTDRTVRLWDTATREQLGTPLIGHNGTVTSVAFSRDGSRLASAGEDGTVRLWDTATREQLGAPLGRNERGVLSVAFSPDGSRLASAGGDGTVRLWDTATREQLGTPLAGHNTTVFSVAFSRDGSRLASAGGDGTVRLWDTASREQLGAPLTGHNGGATSVAFGPDGSRLASAGGDGTIRLWDTVTGRQLGPPLTGHDTTVFSVAFSRDGSRLASTGQDAAIRLWDTATREQLGTPLRGHEQGAVYSVAFHPDGSRLASAGSDGTLRLWDTATGQELGTPLTGNNDWVHAVAFSPDGSRLASAGNDGTVRLWDTTTREQLGTPLRGHEMEVYSVAFSRDGSRLASGGDDGTVRLWDTATHKQLGTSLTGHAEGVRSVAFSRDGSRLASGGDDGTVRLWDTATHKQLGTSLTGHAEGVRSVAFSPDGSRLASGGNDATVRLWGVGMPRDLHSAVCALAGRSLTPQEWQQYTRDEPYKRSCP